MNVIFQKAKLQQRQKYTFFNRLYEKLTKRSLHFDLFARTEKLTEKLPSTSMIMAEIIQIKRAYVIRKMKRSIQLMTFVDHSLTL